MKRLFLLIVLFSAVCSGSWGETLRLNDDLAIVVALPESRWEVSTEAAPELIEETAEHIRHDLEAQGRDVPEAKILEVAGKRLAANELFLRSESGAHIEIDVSPLETGETAPSAKAVKKSAEYAGQSLETEEGVTEPSTRVEKVKMVGASYAYRLDVNYRHHGQKMKFIGLIGFVEPYWLYFYGTAHLDDARDVAQMEAILQSIRLVEDM